MSWVKYALLGTVVYATGIATAGVIGAVALGIAIQKSNGKTVVVNHIYKSNDDEEEDVDSREPESYESEEESENNEK